MKIVKFNLLKLRIKFVVSEPFFLSVRLIDNKIECLLNFLFLTLSILIFDFIHTSQRYFALNQNSKCHTLVTRYILDSSTDFHHFVFYFWINFQFIIILQFLEYFHAINFVWIIYSVATKNFNLKNKFELFFTFKKCNSRNNKIIHES